LSFSRKQWFWTSKVPPLTIYIFWSKYKEKE